VDGGAMGSIGMDTKNLNVGMCQLIQQERERLGIRFVGGYEIYRDVDSLLPGYEGYAHFELERGYPLLCDDGNSFQMVSQEARRRYSKPDTKEQFFECGYEFISIMKLVALSVGTASIYGKPRFSDLTELFPLAASDLFWLNIIQSWIFLGMASDRLRTFFVHYVRCEKESTLDKDLKKQLKNGDSGGREKQFVYIQAFHGYEAECFITDKPRERLGELRRLVDDVADIRMRRNAFVHDYASREAMASVARRDDNKDHADMFRAMRGDKHQEDYIRELVDAYNVLARAGNLVFLLEKDVTDGEERNYL
jgi:hypothetical protein